VHDPRELARILEKAEADLAARRHPDPYISELVCFPQSKFTNKCHLQLQRTLAVRNGTFLYATLTHPSAYREHEIAMKGKEFTRKFTLFT
jgi:hypothetical protein